MKYLFLFLVPIILLSCSTSSSDIAVSKDMNSFLKLAVGSADSTEKALNIYAANENIKLSEMSVYDLTEPLITKNVGECYTVEFSTGELITKVFRICWTQDKITRIDDLGIKEQKK